MIKKIKKFIKDKNLDGYIVSKNDSYFTEYSKVNNLAKVTNFTGSAGFALILKNINYLFIDGRYTLQAKEQSGKNFKILEIPYVWPKDLLDIKDCKIGFNPKLFTNHMLKKIFEGKVNLIPVEFFFNEKKEKKINKLFKIDKNITGETTPTKINKIKKYLKKNRINYLYISASENVNWLLNIRGKDLPNSPIINCKVLITDKGKIYLFININKIPNAIIKSFKDIILCEENSLFKNLINLKNGSFCVDRNTCSIFEQQIICSRFNIIKNIDPIYELKSVKNSIEIKTLSKRISKMEWH